MSTAVPTLTCGLSGPRLVLPPDCQPENLIGRNPDPLTVGLVYRLESNEKVTLVQGEITNPGWHMVTEHRDRIALAYGPTIEISSFFDLLHKRLRTGRSPTFRSVMYSTQNLDGIKNRTL